MRSAIGPDSTRRQSSGKEGGGGWGEFGAGSRPRACVSDRGATAPRQLVDWARVRRTVAQGGRQGGQQVGDALVLWAACPPHACSPTARGMEGGVGGRFVCQGSGERRGGLDTHAGQQPLAAAKGPGVRPADADRRNEGLRSHGTAAGGGGGGL